MVIPMKSPMADKKDLTEVIKGEIQNRYLEKSELILRNLQPEMIAEVKKLFEKRHAGVGLS